MSIQLRKKYRVYQYHLQIHRWDCLVFIFIGEVMQESICHTGSGSSNNQGERYRHLEKTECINKTVELLESRCPCNVLIYTLDYWIISLEFKT